MKRRNAKGATLLPNIRGRTKFKLKGKAHYIIIALLIIIFSYQVISSINIHSTRWDEPGYIYEGYYFLKTGKFLNDAALLATFVGQVSAFPLLALDLEYENMSSRDFIFNNKYSSEVILFLSRIMMAFFYIPLGIYIYLWSKELFGKKAALFALFLFAFSPNLIAHSKFVMHDLPLTCMVLVTTYHYRKFIINPSYKTAILLGMLLGVTLVTKFSGLLLLPIFLIIFTVQSFIINKRDLKKTLQNKRTHYTLGLLLMVLIISFFVVGLDYKFTKTIQPIAQSILEDPFADPLRHNPEKIISRVNQLDVDVIDKGLRFLLYKMPPLLPYDYLRGIVSIYIIGKTDTTLSFIMGDYSRGFWYYYLIAFLVKTPVPIIIFLAISIMFFLRSKKINLDLLYIIVPILIFLGIVSFGAKFNVGLRYVLPIYPFLFIFISNIVNIKKLKPFKILLLGLGVWYLISTILIYPYHFSYFNELVGGPHNGYKFLVEENLDSGQDIKGLAKYIKKNNITDIKISYHQLDPLYYGIGYEDIGSNSATKKGKEPDCKPTKGLIAISATNLQSLYFQNHSCFDWLKEYKPIDNIGYSIFIYNIT